MTEVQINLQETVGDIIDLEYKMLSLIREETSTSRKLTLFRFFGKLINEPEKSTVSKIVLKEFEKDIVIDYVSKVEQYNKLCDKILEITRVAKKF